MIILFHIDRVQKRLKMLLSPAIYYNCGQVILSSILLFLFSKTVRNLFPTVIILQMTIAVTSRVSAALEKAVSFIHFALISR